jgi:TrmH family RNA methyltransferase
MLTSSQNPKIKLIRALTSRPKDRRQTGAFLVEGVRLLEEAWAANWSFRFVLYSNELSERGRGLIERLKVEDLDVEEVSARLLQSASETETSQGILAVLNDSQLPIPESLDFVLIPDAIRDPGNLGTLLRSAAASRVQAALLPPETTDAFAPKVVRAGMGAHFHLPIQPMGWDEIREFLGVSQPRLQVYLAEMNGRSCWDTDLRQPLALIIGGEAGGVSQTARELAAQAIGIPMAGTTESLNAAMAGSILMFEVVRQRNERTIS